VLKRWAPWLVGGIAFLALALAIGWWLFVPVADWLARHDIGNVTGPLRVLRLQQARDAARGRLLTFGAGLFAAGALVFTGLNYVLSREGQVNNRYREAVTQLASRGRLGPVL
jgi:hypothetical protein